MHVAAVDAGLEDVQLSGVEHELVDGFEDVHGDLHAPIERGRIEVRGELEVVARRDRASRQAVRIEVGVFSDVGGGHSGNGTCIGRGHRGPVASGR